MRIEVNDFGGDDVMRASQRPKFIVLVYCLYIVFVCFLGFCLNLRRQFNGTNTVMRTSIFRCRYIYIHTQFL